MSIIVICIEIINSIYYEKTFSKSKRGIITMKNGKEIDLARDRRKLFFEKINPIK